MRLFWGIWASSAGDALDEADIQACIDGSLAPRGKQTGWFYCAGLDLGIKHDHAALVAVAGRRDTQDLRLAYAESWAPDPKTGKVDLMAVECALLRMNERYGFTVVGFDPFQAALMAQRAERQGVKMREVPFTGKALDEMATTLLDVFRSRRITLYNHSRLITDLGRLQIEEKSYGHRLSATRDENGHADLATALAIALPLAVQESGRTPVRLKSMLGPSDPFRYFDWRRKEYEREYQLLEAGGDGRNELPGWDQLVQHVGR